MFYFTVKAQSDDYEYYIIGAYILSVFIDLALFYQFYQNDTCFYWKTLTFW